MSIEREFEGKTVTDAAIEACKTLGITREELESTDRIIDDSYTHLTLPTNREEQITVVEV